MTPEEKKEFDDLKRRVAFLEELCVNYHNVLIEMQKGDSDFHRRELLNHDSGDRDLVLLHDFHCGPLMRNGNIGFGRAVK
jgi:hypothetical protein